MAPVLCSLAKHLGEILCANSTNTVQSANGDMLESPKHTNTCSKDFWGY